MTTFLLIRHGEREGGPDLLPGRMPGVSLTSRGRAQAAAIAAHLRDVRVEQICSSPSERSVQTAAPLARDKQLPIGETPALDEIDFGEWTGRRVSELEADERWRQFNQFRSGTRIPGGQSAWDVQGRIVAELLRLRTLHPDKTIACFSHADPIRLALGYFLGMSVDHFDRLEISVGSISRLMLADWGARVVGMNELPRV